MKIYLCGHGNHHISRDGYFTLPRGASVTIYTLAAKLMHQKDVQSIVAGNPNMAPARVIDGMRQCPNLTLSCDSDTDKKATESAFKKNPDQTGSKLFFINDLMQPADEDDEPAMTLKDIIALAPQNDYVWTCCYNVPFRNNTVLGAKYGMNVIQYVRGGEMHKAKADKGTPDFEINRGDIVNRAREVLRMQNKPSTAKDITAYVNKLDSPRGLPARK